jgi:hypothetical protein
MSKVLVDGKEEYSVLQDCESDYGKIWQIPQHGVWAMWGLGLCLLEFDRAH